MYLAHAVQLRTTAATFQGFPRAYQAEKFAVIGFATSNGHTVQLGVPGLWLRTL